MEINLLHNENFDDLICCGVYLIENLVTNKYYVGSTKTSFLKRWKKHLTNLKHNKHHSPILQNSFNKYGVECFRFIIIDILEIELISSHERYWINILDSVNLGYNSSYSVNGGCLGYKFSNEYRERKSKMMMGNKNLLNIKPTDSTKNQISISMKRFYSTNTEKSIVMREKSRNKRIEFNKNILAIKNKKPIIQYTLDNKFIQEWDSAKDAAKFYECSSSGIICVCKGKQKTAKGFIWKYKNN